MIIRSTWLALALILAQPALAAPASPPSDPAIARRVARVLASTPLIDGHNDWAWALRSKFGEKAPTVALDRDWSKGDPRLHTDILRLRSGGVGGQFWSAWVPPTLKGGAAVEATLQQIDLIRGLVARYPGTFALAQSADDVVRIQHEGRIAAMIGIEGGDQIGGSLAVLRSYRALGASYLTLTHALSTDWADSATDTPRNQGLAPFGVTVIHELNRLGMLVDLAHVSAQTMRAAIAASSSPVIFSHSGARGVTDHGRNVPDDVLRMLVAHDGVVMVPFVASYVSDDYRRWKAELAAEKVRLTGAPYDGLLLDHPEAAAAALARWQAEHPAPRVTLAQVADHIEHIRQVAGVAHVGLGSDFDGTLVLPEGVNGVEAYPALLAELARRGWSDADLAALAGGNVLRVMRKAEAVAQGLKTQAPFEAPIDSRPLAEDAS